MFPASVAGRFKAFIAAASVCALSLSTLTLIALTLSPSIGTKRYANDKLTFIDASPVWDIGPIPQKAMYFEPTVRYKLNSSSADLEWAALIPPNGGIVHIADSEGNRQPFLLSMWHQLRCLDIIRRAYDAHEGLTPEGPSPVARHCLHYLRQTVLCRSDTRLEPVIDTDGPHAVQPWGTMTCKDWTRVYEAQAENGVTA